MAAAACGEGHRADDLIDSAAALASRRTSTQDTHHTAFGPIVVLLARFLTALNLGDAGEAVYRHEQAIRRDDWPLLPAEHRAAHLIDVARAYLQAGDLPKAGHAPADADTIAPAEVRYRPAARTLIAEIAHSGRAAAGVARLATLIGLTR
ncbi:hypothetical protein [Micromonospora sp. NPDC048839]|uniref:hypothetical protein n=1 Tax=Micromonospora sp. NPDC048839 TaxID=3155641 RepID=UPI0033FECE62